MGAEDFDHRQRAASAVPPHAGRNFLVLSGRGVLFRLSWLFKNEAVVVGAFLKTLGASNFVLSLFPLTNRLLRALPQPFIQKMVARVGRKKYVNAASLGVFSACWFGAGLLVRNGWDRLGPGTLTLLFFILYAGGMAVLSFSNLSTPLLSAKLIPAHWRGRMQALGVAVSVPVGMALAFFFIRPAVASSGGSVLPFGRFFINTGAGFACAALLVLLLKEPADAAAPGRQSFFTRILASLRADRNFRRLMAARSMLFVTAGSLPFYTSFGMEAVRSAGREWGALTAYTLMSLEAGKVAGAGLMGFLADRFGNRLALLAGSGLHFLAPASALVLGLLVKAGIVFPEAFVGCYFVAGAGIATVGLSNNYMMEVAPGRRRPIYLAAGNMSMLVSAAVMPVLGAGGDALGLGPVLGVLSLNGVLLGWVVKGMDEPRFKEVVPADPAMV